MFSGEQQEHAGGWTPDRVERMRQMWLVDGFSASQIAAILGEGVTRNGVIGKLHRLKLSGGKAKVAAPTGKRGGAGMPGQAKASSIRRRAESRQRDMERVKRGQQRTGEAKAAVVDAPELVALPIPTGAVWQPLDGRAPISLVDLGKQDCRWPLGDPREAGFGYCGLPQAGDHTSYCERHHLRSAARAA